MMSNRIGPNHYEGWTCRFCGHLRENVGVAYYCNETRERIYSMETPSTCPYLKHAIINQVMEDTS